MIKIAFVVCFAAFAAADAEADAGVLYGAYGYGAGLGYAGLGYGAGLGYAGLGYGAGLGHAGLGYGAGLGYAGLAAPIATGYGVSNIANSVGIAGLAPAAIPAVAGGYAGAGRYVANSAGVVHVAKREAEAEPEAEADAEADPALLYGAYGYAGLGYAGHGYAGYAGYPYAAGYAAHSPSASTHIAGLAPAAIPAIAGGYAGAGRYIANSAGVVHVA